jgi:hypothetical protein
LSGGGVPNGEEVKVTADEAKLRIMIEDRKGWMGRE